MLGEINDALALLRIRQQVERRQQHFLLPRLLPRCAEWPPHEMGGNNDARQAHGGQPVAKSGHADHHSRHAPFFQ